VKRGGCLEVGNIRNEKVMLKIKVRHLRRALKTLRHVGTLSAWSREMRAASLHALYQKPPAKFDNQTSGDERWRFQWGFRWVQYFSER